MNVCVCLFVHGTPLVVTMARELCGREWSLVADGVLRTLLSFVQLELIGALSCLRIMAGFE